MMIKPLVFSFIFLFSIQQSNSQNVGKFRSPVDFDIVMAGNFGEIRANHFHSGIDIKALQGVGSPIFAVADGYVSRIGVAPAGYGNFMMITHPDGRQSLYAHLDSFAKPYRDFIRAAQTAAKSYAIDKYLAADKFPVKAGDRIAALGNSGSSGGPHLHFEIRDGRTGVALNPLDIAGYHVGDNIPPVVSKVLVYQLDTLILGVRRFNLTQTIEYKPNKQGIRIPSDSIIRVNKPFYLAYEVIDYKNGRSNTMGISTLNQMVDKVTNFSFNINKISFATTRFINTLVQYDKNRTSRFHVLRAYKSDNNQLSIYDNVQNQGLISPPEVSGKLDITTVFGDDKENISTISLAVVRDDKRPNVPANLPSKEDTPVFWSISHTFKDSTMRVQIPGGALYDSEFLKICSNGGKYMVGNRNIPLQKAFEISIFTGKLSTTAKWPKALIVSLSDAGKQSSIGGVWEDGILTAQSRSFGTFAVAFDTIKPTIRSLQKQGNLLTSQLKYKIADDLAGINKYTVYIDSQWTLAEYDPKNSLLLVDVVKSKTPQTHLVTIEVSDYKNNITTLKEKYQW